MINEQSKPMCFGRPQLPIAREQQIFELIIADLGMVLPVRIELTTSPFITPTLSRPPQAAFVRWTIPSSWVLADR